MNQPGTALVWMFACAFIVTAGTASAQSNSAPIAGSQTSSASVAKPVPAAPGAKAVRKPAKPYFVEFRARSAQSYGHTFLVHGRVGQKITVNNVVGLHPATESSIPWLIGHLVLVPSETGASDGDIEEQYIIARYRVLLSETEYKRVSAYLKERQANAPVWHAVLYNCNTFIADIAEFMGLKAPFSNMLMPKAFITELKQLNTKIQSAATSTAAAR